jgi:hypothetical protein
MNAATPEQGVWLLEGRWLRLIYLNRAVRLLAATDHTRSLIGPHGQRDLMTGWVYAGWDHTPERCAKHKDLEPNNRRGDAAGMRRVAAGMLTLHRKAERNGILSAPPAPRRGHTITRHYRS